MPTPTYTPLASVTLGSASSSVTFSSLPQTYRDLICVVNIFGIGAFNASGASGRFQFNGNNVGYNWYRFSGAGSAGGSPSTNGATDANQGFLSNTPQASVTNPSQMNIFIADYSATNKHKMVISRSNSALSNYAGAEFVTTRWANTAAVTSFNIFTGGPNFGAGSTFTLYGVIA
jgi:hypothetical protein